MPTGLIRFIITPKVLKTRSNKSVKQHYLGSNQVIRPRDLEWREELEKRETKWREVIRVRDVAFWK